MDQRCVGQAPQSTAGNQAQQQLRTRQAHANRDRPLGVPSIAAVGF